MQKGLCRAFGAMVVMIVALALPRGVQAQEVFTPDQLTQAPRLASASRTAELLRSAAPGVGGTVRLQMVVGADGKVEAGSVKTLDSTSDRLTAAAEKVALRIEFKPGEKDGRPVRTLVVLPLSFQP